MKLRSLINEYSSSGEYVHGVKFKVLVNINQVKCQINYIPDNSINLDKLKINLDVISKTIKSKLEKRLAMKFILESNSDNTGLNFVSTLSELENHIILMLK